VLASSPAPPDKAWFVDGRYHVRTAAPSLQVKERERVDLIIAVSQSFHVSINGSVRTVTFNELQDITNAFEALYDYCKRTPPPTSIRVSRVDMPDGRFRSAQFICERNYGKASARNWQTLMDEGDGFSALHRYLALNMIIGS
jgi:hypothetical protein